MKSKLDLAHEYFMKHVNTIEYKNVDDEDLIGWSWDYADAMYEQHEKRSPPPKTIADIAREINQNIKEDGNCMHFHHEFGHKKCMDCGVSLKEWQPDWSVAPDGYGWFCVGSDGGYGFFSKQKPKLYGDYYFVGNDGFVCKNHSYQGHWRDSLRKRPK